MKKRPLILFSGGLDSSHLLWNNPTADTLSIELVSSYDKVKWEKAARERVIGYIKHVNKERDPDFWPGRNFTTEYSITANTNPNHLNQMAVWFNKMFEYADPSMHSSVMIGYTGGDCAIPDMAYLTTAWDSLWKASRIRTYKDMPPLEFPLAQWSKAEQVRHLPDELISRTWSCEAPFNQNGIECGVCLPCRTKFAALLLGNKTHVASWPLTYAFTREHISRDLLRDMLYARRTIDGRDTIYEHEIPESEPNPGDIQESDGQLELF